MKPYQPSIDAVQVSSNKVLVPFSSGLATGWIEGPPVLQRAPIARPSFKIPLPLWRQCISFLNDVYLHKKWEAHVMFYRRDSDGDIILFCPVQTGSGASTDSVDCIDNEKGLAYLAKEGYDCVGSIHSHCNMAAFQSGTDKDDEFSNQDGFHVTIGKMNDDIMDVHCRAIVTIIDPEMKKKAERHQVPFYLQEFVDGLPDFDKADFEMPHRIKSELIKHYLVSSEIDDAYDPDWIDRIIEKPPVATKQDVRYQQYFGHVYTPPKFTRQVGDTAWISGARGIWNGSRYLLPGDDGYDEMFDLFVEKEAKENEADELEKEEQAVYNFQ